MNTKSAASALGTIRTRSFRNAATNIQSVLPDGSISSSVTRLLTVISNRNGSTYKADRATVNTNGIIHTAFAASSSDETFHVGDVIGVSETAKRKSTGLCTVCKRHVSLSALGILFKHGHRCAGAGVPPVDGSTIPDADNQSQQLQLVNSHHIYLSVTTAEDILQLIKVNLNTCQILKRILLGLRNVAAEKLCQLLRVQSVKP